MTKQISVENCSATSKATKYLLLFLFAHMYSSNLKIPTSLTLSRGGRREEEGGWSKGEMTKKSMNWESYPLVLWKSREGLILRTLRSHPLLQSLEGFSAKKSIWSGVTVWSMIGWLINGNKSCKEVRYAILLGTAVVVVLNAATLEFPISAFDSCSDFAAV